MTLEQVCETFHRAVQILVDENAMIKERLLVAYASQLSLIRSQDELPADVANALLGVRYALSDAESPFGYGERAVKKLHDMSDEEAAELARSILAMFLRVRDAQLAAAG